MDREEEVDFIGDNFFFLRLKNNLLKNVNLLVYDRKYTNYAHFFCKHRLTSMDKNKLTLFNLQKKLLKKCYCSIIKKKIYHWHIQT